MKNVPCPGKTDPWQSAVAKMDAPNTDPRIAADLIAVTLMRLMRASSMAKSGWDIQLWLEPYPFGSRRVTDGLLGRVPGWGVGLSGDRIPVRARIVTAEGCAILAAWRPPFHSRR
jgi:hypothetical protein